MIDASMLLVMGVLYAVGVYLVLEKSLTKVLLGLMLITNATNILILHTAGSSGIPAFFDPTRSADEYFDPLPQALVLTAIVISFSVTALMLGMIYRSWVLSRRDDIMDDAEDRRVAAQPDYDPEDDDAAPIEPSEFEGSEEQREEAYRQRKQKERSQRENARTVADDEAPGLAKEHHSHLGQGNRDQGEWRP
ncbi:MULTISPECIES: Na(+)/H(+) antiporter subunit C [Kocuria]|uniref:Na(+)/H(+) antiporter subunit C n=1 Tax=Kocuria TaxID=57493 RepID=UPI00080A82A3|nr:MULTISPECIES: Na(+)/H(+) antiporter subunit C [Kocuria]MCT1368195.1 Na(+)/H(+) antiporter subunit C [Rothia sp. p3-SID1597]RUQ23240.1 Na(+)/H(+) antiporter subunit C [Kocuria sp. HSID16901]